MVGQKKVFFLKYLNLNSKLDILDNCPNDGTIFPTASKKNQSKSSRQKKVSGRGGAYVPPRHLVVKRQNKIGLKKHVHGVHFTAKNRGSNLGGDSQSHRKPQHVHYL